MGHALLGEETALLAVGCGLRRSRTIESDVDNMGSAPGEALQAPEKMGGAGGMKHWLSEVSVKKNNRLH